MRFIMFRFEEHAVKYSNEQTQNIGKYKMFLFKLITILNAHWEAYTQHQSA